MGVSLVGRAEGRMGVPLVGGAIRTGVLLVGGAVVIPTPVWIISMVWPGKVDTWVWHCPGVVASPWGVACGGVEVVFSVTCTVVIMVTGILSVTAIVIVVTVIVVMVIASLGVTRGPRVLATPPPAGM